MCIYTVKKQKLRIKNKPQGGCDFTKRPTIWRLERKGYRNK